MSIHNALRDIYHFLPLRLRLGREFWRLYDFYDKIQHLSYEKRREFQMQELRRVVTHAYQHTRYYRRLFDEYDIRASQIQDFSDIKKIPILTKDIVSEHLAEMVSDTVSEKDLIYVMTGGSTGKTLGLYVTPMSEKKRMAFTWLNWHCMGYKPGMPCAVLRGNVVKDGWFCYERGDNYLILSTYELSDVNMERYLKKIEEFSPQFIRGYPSALEILAKYILKNNIPFNYNARIRGIATSSEALYPIQKQLIEKAFRARVFDWYGNCEQVGAIGMCAEGRYHEVMEHSYLEFLDDVGNDAIAGYANIIGTTFINEAVPFIRYQTGDAVTLGEEDTSCLCGIQARNIECIEGRGADMLKTRNGNLISVTALNSHSDIFDNARRIQYYQDTPGIVVLKIVRAPDFGDDDMKKIRAELGEKFTDQMELRFAFVDDIPLTPRGKYRYLDQRLRL